MLHEQHKRSSQETKNRDRQEWNKLFEYNTQKQIDDQLQREMKLNQRQETLDAKNKQFRKYLEGRHNTLIDQNEYNLNKSIIYPQTSANSNGFVD
jgi:hypothetical protein